LRLRLILPDPISIHRSQDNIINLIRYLHFYQDLLLHIVNLWFCFQRIIIRRTCRYDDRRCAEGFAVGDI